MNTYKKKNRTYFIGTLVFILISTIFAVSLQFFKGAVLDYAVIGDARNTIKYALLLITFILCEIGFYFCYKRCSAKFVVKCTRQIKQDIFQSILHRSYVSYKEHTQGEYMAKYTNTADAIKDRYFSMLPSFWEILFKIILVSIGLFLLDWRIAIITIALLTTPLYVPKLIEKRLKNAKTDYIKAVESALSKINDWLAGFEIIKNFSIERNILSKFNQVNNNSMEKLLKDMQLRAIAGLLTTLISYLSYFIVLVCATCLVLNNELTAGGFFIAIGMIDQLSYPLISLAATTRELIAIKPICKELEQFLISFDEENFETGLQSIVRAIRFRNVSFAYSEPTPILRDFNLLIQKGKRYLIKGPSGSGKTTIVNLLLRYYNVQSGSIEIDDIPIERVGNIYKLMTVVRQEANLFHDTLRSNLTMYQDISDEKLILTMNLLGLTKYANIEALDSTIMENGGNLSGGEKKRICLARALLRDKDILILDEPLANLDDETAQRIEDLLLSIQGKTMLIVSHQFSENKLNQFEQVIDFAV